MRSLLAVMLANMLAGCAGGDAPGLSSSGDLAGSGSLLGGFFAPATPAAESSSYKARRYRIANATLHEAYEHLSAQLSADQQSALAGAETAWEKQRAADCTADGEIEYVCATRLTERRIAALDANPVRAAAGPAGAAAAAPNTAQPAPTAQTVVVPVTAMPWLWNCNGMNADFKFGYPNGTQPVTVNLANLGAVPGSLVTISYLSGHIGLGSGGPQADASGFAGLDDHGAPGLMGPFPSAYMQPYPINLGALVAVFTDHAGRIVGQPFAVGAARMSRTLPAGASQLQLGINDDVFGGETAATRNSGSFTVEIAVSEGG